MKALALGLFLVLVAACAPSGGGAVPPAGAMTTAREAWRGTLTPDGGVRPSNVKPNTEIAIHSDLLEYEIKNKILLFSH
jgi:hypothetical protein